MADHSPTILNSGTGATEYIWSIQVNTAPAAIDLAAALDGWAPPDRTLPFSYLEIGCGHGLTLIALAAAYPSAHFVGIEPNPAHVAGARALAHAAGLKNIEIIEAAAAACLGRGLGPFDLAVLHGVYSWVPRNVRAAMAALLADTLAPGGRVYVSYNALPGQVPLARVRELLLAEAGEGDPLERARRGAGRLAARLEAEDEALLADLEVATTVAWLARQDPHYIVHELMPDGWEALRFAEVAADMAGAGLVFAAGLPLAQNFAELVLPPDRRARLRPAPDRIAWETARDELAGTRFRRDVYVRPGGERPGRAAALAGRRFVGLVHPGRAPDRVDLGNAMLDLDPRHMAARRRLDEGPATPAEIAAATGLAQAEAVDVVVTLAAAGQAGLMVAPPRPSGTGPWRLTRANRALLEARLEAEAVPLASPVSGLVMPVERQEAMWLAALDQGFDAAWVALRRDAKPETVAPPGRAVAAGQPWLARMGVLVSAGA